MFAIPAVDGLQALWAGVLNAGKWLVTIGGAQRVEGHYEVQGWNAFRDGLSLEDAPVFLGAQDKAAWREGWKDAQWWSESTW